MPYGIPTTTLQPPPQDTSETAIAKWNRIDRDSFFCQRLRYWNPVHVAMQSGQYCYLLDNDSQYLLFAMSVRLGDGGEKFKLFWW